MNCGELEMVVISDVHLGSYGCHAPQLLQYLEIIRPKILILNGDIVDTERLKKNFLPVDHFNVIRQILRMSENGCKVYYLSGNHDHQGEGVNPFAGSQVIFRNQLELFVDHKKYRIFHGDIFDTSIMITPWIARAGLQSYRFLLRINRFIDRWRIRFGKPRLSLANQLKLRIKKAVKYIHDYENIVSHYALKKECDSVICGHIHVPVIKKMQDGKITYMNAGDWVENLTALEYQHREWKIYTYDPSDYTPVNQRLRVPAPARTPVPTSPTDSFTWKKKAGATSSFPA
jgi:UDP-2,3-diacylglucosamine pyrophosphatase LpxH